MQTRPMADFVDPDFIETSLEVFRPIDGGVDVLREFVASIGYSAESGPEDIGSVRGWIGGGSRTRTFTMQRTPSVPTPNDSGPQQLRSSTPIPRNSSIPSC